MATSLFPLPLPHHITHVLYFLSWSVRCLFVISDRKFKMSNAALLIPIIVFTHCFCYGILQYLFVFLYICGTQVMTLSTEFCSLTLTLKYITPYGKSLIFWCVTTYTLQNLLDVNLSVVHTCSKFLICRQKCFFADLSNLVKDSSELFTMLLCI